MKRRYFLTSLVGVASLPVVRAFATAPASSGLPVIERIERSEAEWKRLLTPEQFRVLRLEGTEPAWTSELNAEKREGIYVCVGCGLELFTAEMKYDSGTGWPSFYTTLPGVFGLKRDFKLILPRIEYHCARCGGHHGHVFKDGPPPTGERWCNNGVALRFIPAGQQPVRLG